MIYVFAHQNPDIDIICSALVIADRLIMPGKSATLFHLGEMTPETAFILQQACIIFVISMLTGIVATYAVLLLGCFFTGKALPTR
ncbi:TPA: hypothetical protein ACSG4Z_004166 [Escherichia coli]|uniref:hypothetical protein n=1 Tax=Escherichia coli TaxID=562 RepID=UPI00201CBE8A|nr:hypothetical protein [Escherichia coli]